MNTSGGLGGTGSPGERPESPARDSDPGDPEVRGLNDETADSTAGDPSEATGAPSHAPTAPPLTEEEEGYLAQLQRLQAEFANYRKRTLRERAEWESRAQGDLVQKLIPVLDDLARAREAHGLNPPSAEAEGLLLILSRLEEALFASGLETQAPPTGTWFDPNVHDALMGSPSEEYPEGMIIDTIQLGYLYRGLLLRPARVRVSQGPPVASS